MNESKLMASFIQLDEEDDDEEELEDLDESSGDSDSEDKGRCWKKKKKD